jgi:hypothetical protein
VGDTAAGHCLVAAGALRADSAGLGHQPAAGYVRSALRLCAAPIEARLAAPSVGNSASASELWQLLQRRGKRMGGRLLSITMFVGA